MARGSIRKRQRQSGIVYEAVLDLGVDPVTGKRVQRAKAYRTKREAHAALIAMLADAEKGLVLERSTWTVADLLRYWLETYARPNVRPTTLDQYSNTVEHHLVPALGTIPIQKLTPTHLQQFYADKARAGAGPRSVQLCHLRLHQALDMAVRLGLVARNVADVVAAPRVPRQEMRTWTVAQARRFLEVARNSGYGPVWMVLLATGMRRGEVLGLRWQDVEWEGGVLHVRQSVTLVRGLSLFHQPKSRSAVRAVPVSAVVIEALRAHRQVQDERKARLGPAWHDYDLVFASEVGTPIGPRNLGRDFAKWVVRAGVPAIRIHDIRHTVVTQALASGSPIKAVSQHVGHAQTSITMDIYAHVLPHHRAEVAQKLGQAFLGQATEGVASTEDAERTASAEDGE